jgi:parallel beta-helix repeat protein
MKIILISTLLLMLILGFVAEGRAEIDVAPGESIQQAIDNATDGSTIWVESGIYQENINIDKQISLEGWNTDGTNPVIIANDQGSSVIILSANGVALEGFQVRNSWNNAGIEVDSWDNYIEDIDASNNEYGIYLGPTAGNTTIGSSNFSQNRFGIYLDSINYAFDNEDNGIIRNKISNNNYGIYLTNSGYNIQGNDISTNQNDAFDDSVSDNGTWNGNYYSQNGGCQHHNNDGTCDSSYNITGGQSQDNGPIYDASKIKIPDRPGRENTHSRKR